MEAGDQRQERRVTLRLLAYWEKLRGAREMPEENDINPDDILDLWDYSFMLHVSDLQKTDYNYVYLGPAIIEAYQGGLQGDEAAQHVVSLNARLLAPACQQVVATRRPVLDEGEFRNAMQKRVLYRQCLLPLGRDDTVEAIFGGMRFKVAE
jgi:hypothetical protein